MNYLFVCVCVCVRARVSLGAWACACACVNVALLIQHAKRVCHIVTSSVAPRSPLHFSTLSHQRHDFRKNVSHSRKNSARYCHKCEKSLHVEYPFFLPDFNET
jgi:tRNA G26 N,N-dimethylase Trm1